MNYHNFNFLETNKQAYATSTKVGIHYVDNEAIFVNVGYGRCGGICCKSTKGERDGYPEYPKLLSIYDVHMLNTYIAWMNLL